MKTLKLQVVNNPAFNKVLVKVTEQTSRGVNFGDADNAPNYPGSFRKDLRKFVSSTGLVLGSNQRPAKDEDDPNTLWVRGSNYAKDNTAVAISRTQFEKLQVAVREYNQFFSDAAIYARQQARAAREAAAVRPAGARPAADGCSYVIG